jgi:uncharacterized DUF497 family protein
MNNLKIAFIIFACLIFSKMNGQDLIQHKWKERIIIVQTTEGVTPIFERQISEFMEAKEEFAERKLVLYKVVDDKYSIFDYQDEKKSTDWIKTADNLSKLDAFRVILIGLDSEVKLGQTEFLSRTELFELIDSMSMRKAEIKEKNKVKN